MVWCLPGLVAVTGIASLAIDFGHVRVVKSQMQSAADAAALGAISMYEQQGLNTAYYSTSTLSSMNPVDATSGVTPSYTYTWGTFNDKTGVFTPGYGTGTASVKVDVARTKAKGNGVPVLFGNLIGFKTADVSVSSIATIYEAKNGSVNVASTANLHLSGMPNGTTTDWGDNTTNAKAYQMVAIPVVAGTWVSFTNAQGTTCIVPGYTGNIGPEGEAARPLHHGENYNGADWRVGSENGIADAIIPANSLTGVFLTDNAPTSRTAPSGAVDWSNAAQANRTSYDDLELQRPFKIGDGKTSGNVVQKFLVPPGATRMYLAIWDGVSQSNNTGNVTAEVQMHDNIRIVR